MTSRLPDRAGGSGSIGGGGAGGDAGPSCDVLRRVYGSGVAPILKLLVALGLEVQSEGQPSRLTAAYLLRPDDPSEYSRLLQRGLGVRNRGSPRLPAGCSLQQTCSQDDLVNRAVEMLIRASYMDRSVDRSVLCLGYRKCRTGPAARPGAGLRYAESYFPNAVERLVRGPAWQRLLSRIGDSLMLHMLQHTSCFVALPNECFLQVTGPQVQQTWNRKLWGLMKLGIDIRNPPPRARKQQQQQQRQQSLALTQGIVQTPGGVVSAVIPAATAGGIAGRPASPELQLPLTQPEEVLDTAQHAGQHQQDEEGVVDEQALHGCRTDGSGGGMGGPPAQAAAGGGGGAKANRAARPSSWQRRKAAKARAAAADADAADAATAAAVSEQAVLAEQGRPSTPEQAPSSSPSGSSSSGLGPGPVPMERDPPTPLTQLQKQQQQACEEEDPSPLHPFLQPPAQQQQYMRQQQRLRLAASGDAAQGQRRAVGRQGRGGAPAPAGWAPPSRLLLPRDMQFYCARFPMRSGLPAQHMLMRVQPTRAGARQLYAAIFDRKHNPMTRPPPPGSGASGKKDQSYRYRLLPPPPRRIPRSHAPLVQLLRQMIRRCRKCPLAILLRHHCPIPTDAPGSQPASSPGLLDEVMRPPPPPAALGRAGAGALGKRRGKRARHGGTGEPTPSADCTATVSLRTQPQQQQTSSSRPSSSTRGGLGGAETAATAAAAAALDAAAGDGLAASSGGEVSGQVAPRPVAAAAATHNAVMAVAQQQQRRQQRHHHHLGGMGMQPGAAAASSWARQAGGTAGAAAAAAGGYGGVGGGCDGGGGGGGGGDDGGAGGGGAARPPQAAAHSDLVSCCVPHSRVSDFVWAVLRKCVPEALLGSPLCQSRLRSVLHRFITLRRYEQMTVHDVMQGVGTARSPWLAQLAGNGSNSSGDGSHIGGGSSGGQRSVGGGVGRRSGPPSSAAKCQRLLSLWLGWLMCVLVLPVLRFAFYCTESEPYRNHVFYYRKPVWMAMRSLALSGLVGQQYARMPASAVLATMRHRTLGNARLRLLPKKSGMRPIVNLGCKTEPSFRADRETRRRPGAKKRVQLSFKAVNTVMQPVLQVLKHEVASNPSPMGATVSGYAEIHARLHPFASAWRAAAAAGAAARGSNATAPTAAEPRHHRQQQQQQHQGTPPPAPSQPYYFVCLDISRAFDNVSVPRLLPMAQRLLRHEQYIVMKYTEVSPSLGSVRCIPRQMALPVQGGCLGPGEAFPQVARDRLAPGSSRKVFADQVLYTRMDRAQACDLLEQHLGCMLLKIGRHWYRQRRGIPQGSSLSTLLCSLYLSDLEARHVQPLLQLPVAAVAALGIAAHAGGPPGGAPGHMRGQQAGGLLATQGTGQGWSTGSSSRGHLSVLASAAAAGTTTSSSSAGGGGGGTASDLLQLTQSPAVAGDSQGHAGGGGGGGRGGGRGAGGGPGPSRSAPGPGSLLMRLVDDSLLITSSRTVAEAYVLRMMAGSHEYGLRINPDKTALNFDMVLPPSPPLPARGGTPTPAGDPTTASGGDDAFDRAGGGGFGGNIMLRCNAYVAPDGSSFIKWCGLLISTDTLEVQADYTRYSGEDLSSSITLPRKPGSGLETKVCTYMRPKCIPLLLDMSINSPSTVRLNVFQILLMAAMKMHSYLRHMRGTPSSNPEHVVGAMEGGIRYLHRLMHARVRMAQRKSVAACWCQLSWCHVRWLGLVAFQRVLSRKQARYRGHVLTHLRQQLASPEYRHLPRQLAAVVDPSRSAVFDDIIF